MNKMDNICLLFMDIGIEDSIWIVAFGIGLLLFLIGWIYAIRNKERTENHWIWATFWEFLACWVLYIPEEIYNDIPSHGVFGWIEGLFTALIKSFNMLFQNGYERVVYDGQAICINIYNILRISTNIAMLLFAGAFILKLISGLQIVKLWFLKKRYIYFFSACNEKTLSIANSILDKNEKIEHKKAVVVFAGDSSSVNFNCHEPNSRIDICCIDSAFSYLISKYVWTCAGMELFLFNDSEEKNLVELENACSILKEKRSIKKIRIYVELSETPWGLYDNYPQKYGLNEKNVIVNFIRMEESFVYNNLLKNSIFEKAIDAEESDNKETKTKMINVIIVGKMNPRNIEFFKALLHLSQMPGYLLNLTVLDSESGRKKLKQLMPEIENDGSGVGDAIYHIDYIENLDFDTDDLERTIIGTCPKFTFAFVNTGDDLISIQLALRIKALATRNGRGNKDYTLQVVIHNKAVWEKWDVNLCKGINPVGSLEEDYNYDFVTNSMIESGSEAIHKARHNTTEWSSYLNNEYNRHSVFARTLSYKYKIQILGNNYQLAGSKEELQWSTKEELDEIWSSMTPEEKEWKMYEHMRWNMYTRTLGYSVDSAQLLNRYIDKDRSLLYEIKGLKRRLKDADEKDRTNIEKQVKEKEKEKKENWNTVKTIRSSAKIHNDLVPYDKLPLEEKIKDNLELTDKVVDELRKI